MLELMKLNVVEFVIGAYENHRRVLCALREDETGIFCLQTKKDVFCHEHVLHFYFTFDFASYLILVLFV